MILHIDMDCFFVSVERVLDPSLEGKPVIVGGTPEGRGVVASASYEARAFGVRSAMPAAQAKRLCPQALFLPGRHGAYGDYSRKVEAILDAWSPVVEPASIDEFYVDLAGTERLHGPARKAAEGIRREVKEKLGLPCSIGISRSRVVAKIAAGKAKPIRLATLAQGGPLRPATLASAFALRASAGMQGTPFDSAQGTPAGIVEVPEGGEAAFLAPLDVQEMPGIGPKTAPRLRAAGLRTLGDVAAAPVEVLARGVGSWAEGLRRLARGEDDTPVGIEEERKSLGHEETYEKDLTCPEAVDAALSAIVERVCHRLRKQGIAGRTLTLKLRWADFETITRSETLDRPVQTEESVLPAARALLARARTRRLGIRLLGLAASNLGEPVGQGRLFEEITPKGAERAAKGVDAVRARFGYRAIRRAGSDSEG